MPSEEDPIAEAAYDEVAARYDAAVEDNPYNADLEFPGTSALIPDVEGDRVLDAGCGTGIYTEWLLGQGAEVVGVDVSEEMLDRAGDRVGDRATFHRADLGEPLDFLGDDAFDGVVSALALDHVRDWGVPFSEFARVVRPGGFLVFSVGHPLEEYVDNEDVDYFERERVTTEWWDVDVPYYRRPLAAKLAPLLDAGLRVDDISEPQPTEAFGEKRPERYEKESRQPVFLCLRAINE